VGSRLRSVPRWAWATAAAVVVAAGGVALTAASLAGSSDPPAELLPDLEQRSPYSLSGQTVPGERGPRFRLGFGSSVDNVGAGPLLVVGRRDPGAAAGEMLASQLVRRSDGSTRTYPGVGRLRYTLETSHQHWHLARFQRYELRGATGSLVRPDRKTGFCLGDRYESDLTTSLEGEPEAPIWVDECGRSRPSLATVRAGISVGYGDNYLPHLEGQYVDITGVPAGRYELVHRVNADKALRESNYANNAASIVVEIDWPQGQRQPPRIDVVGRCGAGRRCR
jgi:hypothetical protein